jgi:hypothetical protein
MNTFNRMNGMWIRCVLSVGLAWAAASVQALAPGDYVPLKPKQVPGDTSVPLPVDPARCSKGDKKYIYWAAKEQVFRLRFDPDLPVYAIPDRDLSGQALLARKEIPQPPDPKEPEGCYGNPLRGLAMPYFAVFADRVYQDLFGRPRFRNAMYLSGSAIARETEFGPGFWPGGIDRSFHKRPHCRARDSGMQMCLMNNNQDPNTFNPAHVYVIPRSMLPSYVGNKDIRFVVSLGLSRSSDSVDIAMESYFKLFGNVLVKLTPPFKPGEIDLMIPYHIKLIQYVIDAHVPGYDWRARQ